jgi:hypothetical protein
LFPYKTKTMKKNLLILSAAVLAFSLNTVKAQTIINTNADNMETWAPDVFGVNEPNGGGSGVPGWQCLNILSSSFTGSSPVTVFEENTIVHQGSHSCKIVSDTLTATSYSYVKGFVPDTVGVVLSGTLTSKPSFIPGVPFTKRITAVTFWYQYIPKVVASIPDTAYALVELTHHTTATNILGGGTLKMTAAGTWTQGTIPVFYDSLTGNPDSITVVFSACNYTSKNRPLPGSILYVDQVATTSPAGVEPLTFSSSDLDVYPNPSSSQVNFRISMPGNDAFSIAVYDITGKKIGTYDAKNGVNAINTSGFNSGLYFYQLYSVSGQQLKTGKFSVVR